MTPLNNISINTLDKSYNVFSTSVNKILEKISDTNNIEDKTINNEIDYTKKLEFASENEKINSQDELKNILENVKQNIKNTNLSNVHKIDLSNKVITLLN